VTFQNALPLVTRVCQTIRRSRFLLFTLKLFPINFELGFSSGIKEPIDAQFYGGFHVCKVKISRLKTFAQFGQVRWQCWQKKSTVMNFFIFTSCSKTKHIASSLFSDRCFSAAQIPTISFPAVTVASLDNHFVLHALCNRRSFSSLMHHQASRSQR